MSSFTRHLSHVIFHCRLRLVDWVFQIEPQLVVENALPCMIEYRMVQIVDEVVDLDPSYVGPEQKDEGGTNEEGQEEESRIHSLMSHAGATNARRKCIKSGEVAHVFGLEMDYGDAAVAAAGASVGPPKAYLQVTWRATCYMRSTQ